MERPLEEIDRDRRRYLARLTATIAGAGLGVFAISQVIDRESREFSGLDRATEWLNSPPLTAASLAGKVVLVDFWTYTCINWLRTLPYVRAWAQKYRDHLVVIGVHTPEFPFEQDVNNVRRAVREMGIEYPVAVDNEYAVWRALRNQVLASPLLRRCAGTRSRSPLRRGEIRAVRAEDAKTARRSGWHRTWH